tara:strand:+ start:3866 stop:4789 length:924 start_codon:yes stop_codon:yes gene_type:complete
MNFKKPEFWDYPNLSIWTILLYPFSLIFTFAFFISRLFKVQKKFPIPIICIGNIYLGGTGKTPLALEVFKIIKSLKKNPGFIKKGYDYLHDEIQMLKNIGEVFTNKDRKKAINSLILSDHDVAILDDGFQDFAIKKDFSVLCFNSKQLIGNGFVIPSGPLRENFSSIKKADCIFINGDKNLEFENKINKINESLKIFYSKYKIKNLEKFKNKKVIAFAGIGNPKNFFDLLKINNLDIKKTISFPDHYNYTESDYNSLIKNDHDEMMITTEKDYSRIDERMKKYFHYVELDLVIENKNEFVNLIKSKL